MFDDYFYLGKITKAHGFKGKLIAFLDTDEPEKYTEMEMVFLDVKGLPTPFFFKEIQAYRQSKILFEFENLTPEQSLALVGKAIYLPISQLPELEGDKFYYHELIGFHLVDLKNNQIGEILRVLDNASQDLLEIKVDKDNQPLLVPLIDEWIIELDRKAQSLKMNLPEGLLDL